MAGLSKISVLIKRKIMDMMLHMTKRKSIYILQRNVKVLGGSVDMVSKGRRGWAGWVYFITAMTQTQQHARCALVFHSDPLQA